MNLNDITIAANDYTDENFTASRIRTFVDEAIAVVNVELKAKLPYFPESSAEAYTALNDKYIRTFVIPYVAYSIKMNDGSLNEASVFETRWTQGLFKLNKNKKEAIHEDYRESGFLNAYKITQYGRFR